MDKAAKYHNWVALPLKSVTIDGPPFSVPRHLHLDLGNLTQRNVARFRLHSHALRVETRSWQHHGLRCQLAHGQGHGGASQFQVGMVDQKLEMSAST